MTLAEHLSRAARQAPTRTGLVAGDQQWTYAQFHAVSDNIARSLLQLGIGHGDRVALQLANTPELVLSYQACFKIGAIAVPINNRFAPSELEYTLNHCASRLCISQPDLYAGLAPIRHKLPHVEHYFLIGPSSSLPSLTRPFDELLQPSANSAPLPAVVPEDVAAILYTSGTTSRPKGVTHTHGSLCATVRLHGTQIGLQADDVICVIPPMCHILGFATQMLGAVWAAAKLVIVPRNDAGTILKTIHEQQATRIAVLPVLLQAMNTYPDRHLYPMPQMRTICAGGDAVPVAVQRQFEQTFGTLVQEGCGMTEVIPFTLNLPNQRKLGSIGRACPGMHIRLVDDLDQDVPQGEVGEILVKSEAAMIGYWCEPEITAATFAAGYVRTGDLGRLDEDGYYWFMGRKKEIIIRAGSNISPLEVEEVLYQHPAVRECGAIGVPDAELGEVVWAYVATRGGMSVTAGELCEFMAPRIAAYKIPARIEFLDELPKGSTGKVHRRTLKQLAAAAMV